MTDQEIAQLRFLIETQLAIFREARLDEYEERRVLDALFAISRDRCLSSESKIVRDRYIARWIAHALHLTQAVSDKSMTDIKCQIIGILKIVRSQTQADESDAWFHDYRNHDYRKTGS